MKAYLEAYGCALNISESRLFKFLHLPIQSGSDQVLHLMDRDYTAANFLEILESIRGGASSFSLSADMIVGHPGETDDDNARTAEYRQEIVPEEVPLGSFYDVTITGATPTCLTGVLE